MGQRQRSGLGAAQARRFGQPGGRPSPPDRPRRRSVRRDDGKARPTRAGPALHPVERAQPRRPPAPQPRSPGAHRPRAPSADPAPTRGQPPTHPDLEDLERLGLRRQARPCRRGADPVPEAVFRLRPVRAAVGPPAPRFGLGAAQAVRRFADDLPAHPRHPSLPRLLLGRRQQRRELPDADLRLLGQPIEPQFGPQRTLVITNSNHPDHTVPARELREHLRWRNANAYHPDVQRRDRARIRSERDRRRGRPRAA